MDFRAWSDSKEFPGTNPLTRDFLQHLLREDATRKLWRHQREAVLRIIYSYELLNEKRLLLNIVTGGGKTAIIAAVIAWLKYSHNFDKFLLLCPNTIVRDRLEDDLKDANVFRYFQFFPPGAEHYTNDLGLHIMESGKGPQGMLENGIILGNIHQLYESNINGKRNLAYLLNFIEELAVFNDEAHNTPAPEYDNVLFRLSRKARIRIDTTATPDRADGKTPDSRMLYEYNISDAQAEVPPLIKSIVVYQPKIRSVELSYTNPETGERRTVDEMDEEFEKIEKGLATTQWVTDPDPMRKQIQLALNRLNEQAGRAKALGGGEYKPLLFVVAICIKDAEQAKKMLEEEFRLRTLLVTEKSDESDRREARNLRSPNSPYEAVVSVLMLREGWDVPRVSVILLLRKFSSPVYGQQVVGRGLRLNIRDRDIQEICAIVDHEKLKHQWLWELVNAKVRKEVDQGSLFGDEDLPPKRKPQILVNPEKLIKVPPPQKEEKPDFLSDLEDIEIETEDFPEWRKTLGAFTYETDVEISNVRIDGIIARPLDSSRFVEHLSYYNNIDGKNVLIKDISQFELIEALAKVLN
ncbi:MAG: DEAD/DEAH box helicase family protein [candidate division Zixibacteria bacterium]|nr:DEAD/DEAH box helicase family protein [Candidatus Tariuqbacter arcticus]